MAVTSSHSPSTLVSMKIDYDEGRPLETTTMFGNPIEFARAKGVNLPPIDMYVGSPTPISRSVIAIFGRGNCYNALGGLRVHHLTILRGECDSDH